MKTAIIYKTGKSAMQAGLAKAEQYIVKPTSKEKIYFKHHDTNWSGSMSTLKQEGLIFQNRQGAINFCTKNEITYTEVQTYTKKIGAKSYIDTLTK